MPPPPPPATHVEDEPNPFDASLHSNLAAEAPSIADDKQPLVPAADEYAGDSESTLTVDAALPSDADNPFDSPSVPHQLSLEMTSVDSVAAVTGITNEEILPVCWKRETRELLKLTLPAVLVNLLFVAMGSLNQMLVGHVDSDSLAAAVCANLVFNVLWFFAFGFAGALDTLAAQSFGAGSIQGVNIWTKRAFFLTSLLLIPLSLPMFFSYDIMHSVLGQPENVARSAQTFCRWLVFGIWPHTMTVVLQKYLQAQGIMSPIIWIGAMANVVNVLLEALLIWPAGMGASGGALGMSLARWLQFLVSLWYVTWRVNQIEKENAEKEALGLNGQSSPVAADADSSLNIDSAADPFSSSAADGGDAAEAARPSPSRLQMLRHHSSRLLQASVSSVKNSARTVQRGASEAGKSMAAGARQAAAYARDPRALVVDAKALHKESMEGVWNKAAIWQFIQIGISAGLMAGLEAWAFESTGIMAASLSLLELDGHYVLLNCTLISYFTFPFGISIAASIRVGNLIGAGHIATAQMCSKIVAVFGCGFMTISGMILASAHNVVGYLFSNDAAVVAQVARIAPIGGLFQFFDGLQGSLNGVLRGLGLQQRAALSNFIGMWVFGVTCGYLIAFPGHVGLPGLWWGLAIGLLVTSSLNCIWMYRVDWQQAVIEARERIRMDEEEHRRRREEIERAQSPKGYLNEYDTEAALAELQQKADAMHQEQAEKWTRT